MYVRASGNDDNDGSSPAQALRTMTSAASRSAPGTTIHVGPGVYTGRITFTRVAGTADEPIQLLADPSGRTTGDAAGDVVLDAGGDSVNLVVTRTPFMTIDGFVFQGSVPQTTPDRVASTGIGLRTQSHSVTIRNCVFTSGGLSDGVRIDASSDALVFDNLFHDNDRGIVITGDSQRTRVINNTLVNHLRTGIAIAQRGGVAPADTTVTNNIVQGNENNIAISVDEGPPSALEGYSGNFNLAFEPGLEDQTTVYRPDSIRGAQDVNADAVLANPDEGDVHLGTDSPAIDAGSDGIGSDLVDALRQRSTVVGGAPDEGNVDLGYHYRRAEGPRAVRGRC
jgi:parallel beta-helix repeat protein